MTKFLAGEGGFYFGTKMQFLQRLLPGNIAQSLLHGLLFIGMKIAVLFMATKLV